MDRRRGGELNVQGGTRAGRLSNTLREGISQSVLQGLDDAMRFCGWQCQFESALGPDFQNVA